MVMDDKSSRRRRLTAAAAAARHLMDIVRTVWFLVELMTLKDSQSFLYVRKNRSDRKTLTPRRLQGWSVKVGTAGTVKRDTERLTF